MFNEMIDDVHRFQVYSDQLGSHLDKESITELYHSLVREEFKELEEAIASKNDAHILNEALDLIWVIIGFCNVKGFRTDAAWKVLTKANMSKLQHDPETRELLRHPNGKIKKPSNWKAPDYSPFVPNQ